MNAIELELAAVVIVHTIRSTQSAKKGLDCDDDLAILAAQGLEASVKFQ